MFLLAGISSKIKPGGIIENCVCPACGRVASLHVIHKYMTPHIFFIPTFHFHSEFIATCGNCASVMELDTDKGRAFIKDPETRISPEDMRVMQNNARHICVSCGAQIYPGQGFCGGCGRQI